MVIAANTMTNSDFLAEVYGDFEPGTFGWVCSFRADPAQAEPGMWAGRPYQAQPNQAAAIDRATQDNTYFCTAVLRATADAELVRRKDGFYRLSVLVLDDVQLADLQGYSYAIQTSPGKYQVGIFIDGEDPDSRDLGLINRLMQALSTRGFIKADASGNNPVRLVRLPYGMNTKQRAAGPWQVKLEGWNPKVRWSLEDACAACGIDLDALRAVEVAKPTPTTTGSGNHAGEMVAGLLDPNPASRVYHDSIIRLAASLIAGGMYPGAAVEHLYSLMDMVKPQHDLQELRRWEARRAEIPRAVKSAEKFAPAERATNITVNLGVPKTEGGEAQDVSLLIGLEELQRLSGNIKWQVKHLIPENSLGMLFGASGTYKSFIALDHCLHVAHGLNWMGHKTKRGGVVYVAAEGGAGIYRRVQAWHQHHKLELAQNFHVCTTPLVLSQHDHIEALATAIEALDSRPSLIYIDTLSQTFDGDENSNTDIANYLRAINAFIRAKFECTVNVIHHNGHSATERPRGASSIIGNVDFLIAIHKPDGLNMAARLDVIKQKDSDKLVGQAFKLNRIVLGHDEDGEELSSLVAQFTDNAGNILASAARKLNAHEQVVMGLLQGTSGCLDADLRNAFYDELAEQAKRAGKAYVQDNARRSYTRAMESLLSKGLILVSASGFVMANTGDGDA